MAFQGWSDYVDLLDELRARGATWSGAVTFAEFDSLIRIQCADLVRADDQHGYDALVDALDADFTDRDQLYEQLRICALARTAAEAGLNGAEWTGYHVSARLDGIQVYAAGRFAATSDWVPLEVSVQALTLVYDDETGLMYDAEHWYLADGQTEVWADSDGFRDAQGNRYVKGVLQSDSATDLRQTHFDAATNRWRQWHEADGEFEYYHNVDGVWERSRNDLWYRRYDDRLGWLPYDEASQTWLDPTTPSPTWRPHDDVGASPVSAGAAEVFANMSDRNRATLSDLARQALAVKPASMSDEEALRLLSAAVSAQAVEVSSS
jgi:hypothetical protein